MLRNAGGDVEKAKRAATAARRQHQQEEQPSSVIGGRSHDAAAVSQAQKNGGKSEKVDGKPRSASASVSSAGPSLPKSANDALSQTQYNDGNNNKNSSPPARSPPRHSASINNLSDRQYCCVWSVEVYEDGYRPDVARTLLATVARHVNPILRDRGWRVKRLIESASTQWIGLCTANGRNDADAASTNIQLNLRVRPDRHCKQFRSFHQILAVMLHEITHTSIGLEDIHPPAFYELLDQIKIEYRQKLAASEVDIETDDYGCNGQFISKSGEVASVTTSASDIVGTNGVNKLGLLGASGGEGDCGASKKRRRMGGWKKRNNHSKYSKGYKSNVPKKRPLLKGTKMIDKRTKVGKAAMAERENLSARELAARAALARFGNAPAAASPGAKEDSSSESEDEVEFVRAGKKGDVLSSDDEEDDGADFDEPIDDHNYGCGCRSCDWSKLFSLT